MPVGINYTSSLRNSFNMKRLLTINAQICDENHKHSMMRFTNQTNPNKSD